MISRPQLALPFLLIACGSGGGTEDSGLFDGNFDAAFPWEYRVVTLGSGLQVEAWGPVDELDRLGDSPTAEQLCQSFDLSLAILFDTIPLPTLHAAAAGYRAAPRPCEDNPDILCAHEAFFALQVEPTLVQFEVPSSALGPGYFNHPLGVGFWEVETRATGSPFFTGLFDSRTTARVTGLLHANGEAAFEYQPATWTPSTDVGVYSGPQVWARIVEEPFPSCVDPDALMPTIMDMAFVADLAACGIIFAMPFPVNAPDATNEALTWCPGSPYGYGVALLATPEEHPDSSTICPRPGSATSEYLCYTQ